MPIPFELRPDMPEEGVSASGSGLSHPEHVEAQLLRQAREAGEPMVLPDHLPKTHLAILMAEVARDHGAAVHAAVHAAIYSAYFGEGRDIGDRTVLLGIALQQGLQDAEVIAAWKADTYEERLRAFAQLALSLGVGTTPAAFACSRLMLGTQPYRVMREVMAQCARTTDDRTRAERARGV